MRCRARTIASSMSEAQCVGARGGQGRRDDEDLAAPAAAALADLLEQRRSADGLVGDDQQPVAAVAAAGERDVLRAACPRESR